MNEKIKVLIVDGSAIFRQALSQVLSSDPRIEVVGTASDPYIAANKMNVQAPDVITMAIELPRMDGLTFLKKIMTQHPVPVIVISHLVDTDPELISEALEHGATKVVPKSVFDNFD